MKKSISRKIIFTKEREHNAKTRVKPWASPIFSWLAVQKNEPFVFIKNQLEEWIRNIGSKKRKDILGRLVSFRDKEHLSAFFELMWHQFLFEEGYKIKIEPRLKNGKRPEFFVVSRNQDFYFEVVASFADEELQKKIKTTEEVLGKVARMKSYYPITVSLNSWLEPHFKHSDFLRFVRETLQIIEKSEKDFTEPKTFLYEKNGADIQVQVYPKYKEESSVLMAVHYPGYSGVLGSDKIKGRIQEKISKYRDVKALKKPLVISLCFDSGSSTYGQPSVEYDLFGRPMVVFSKNEEGESRWAVDGSGLFMQKNKDGSPKNTRLSAVISCKRKWDKTEKYPEGSYVYEMEVFHNPFASCPIEPEVFKKLPQYVPVRDETGGHMEWINKSDKENRVIIF